MSTSLKESFIKFKQYQNLVILKYELGNGLCVV